VPSEHPFQSDESLVAAAAAGSRQAWDDLVDRFAPGVWSVARNHGLATDEAAVVSRATWMRLVESLNRMESPDRVGEWLAETVRRESLRLLRLRGRPAPEPTDAGEGSGPRAERPLGRSDRPRSG
jgi:DNA-directed RNA polymerase specialized sigma24 family protein